MLVVLSRLMDCLSLSDWAWTTRVDMAQAIGECHITASPDSDVESLYLALTVNSAICSI